ncbi:DUF6443 domain-containing protein [Chitinophaga sp. YIM B06452]|uniref:DUF6443 domain-containing protein n=1 Tax=Chitinophaga sp. YIM B06452 TaxID=3082158 RepID=UPI0031FF34D1
MLSYHVSQAQNAPNTSSRPSATAATVPAAYTNPTINYIRTWEPAMPTTDPAVVTATARTVKEVKQATQYFDGLGRPIQQVSKGMSGGVTVEATGGKDLVNMQIYDAYGREQLKYLPYVPQTGNTSDGLFKTAPFAGQAAFYQNATLNPGAQGESIYYKRTAFEASPLNRVLSTYAPGNSWALEGGNKPVSLQYLVNAVNDSVHIWDMPTSVTIPTSAAGRVYGAGQLYKNITQDEAGNQVVEYKDKEERVILKKVQLAVTPGTAHVGWLCTYYVYDDLNNLRCVIPPRAVELINSSWVISTSIADELCFRYQYDGRRRMIEKRVPGAGPVQMVYDVRDRLVFTQDSVQRAKSPTKEWLVTFYDALNRPVMTALYPSNSTRDQLQTAMNTATTGTTLTYTAPGVADLVVGNRQTGLTSYKATGSVTFQPGFESETAAEFVAEIDPALQGLTTQLTVSNPLPSITGYQPLTYTFYDNYTYTGSHSLQSADLSKPQAGTNPYAESVTAASTMTKGLTTGSRIKVLGTSDQWLTTTMFYDNKGRVIQAISDNTGGGKDIVTSLYDFNGKVLSSYVRHTNPRSGATPQTTVLTMNTYDAAGRLRSIKKQLNDNTALERTVATMDYDELGQLKEKKLGVTSASTQLEKLAYEYNVRGWLKGINKTYVSTAGSTTNWFGQELSYDYGFTTNQYNGNIGGAKWKSGGDGIARAMGFGYDKANRLTATDFNQQNTGTTTWQKNLVDFSVNNLAYDANGNILSMTQRGLKAGAPATVDQLSYAYYANSNRLRYVRDNVNDVSSTLGDFKEPTANNTSNQSAPTTDFDYSYDVNGNMMADKNKEITGIVYNHLNLPQTITITGKGTIAYQYDAAGNKLKKTVTDNTITPSKVTTTDYMSGGLVYENDTLQLLSHEEGRIRTVFQSGQPLQYRYDYFVKDHLGNIRVVLTEQTDFSMYMASMEPESAAKENALFSNIDATRTEKPAGYPEDATPQATTETTIQPNSFVAKLNGNNPDKKIGPSLVLKVMAGDTIQIGAKAFYKSGPAEQNNNAVPQDMLGALISAFGNGQNTTEPGHGAANTAVNNTPFNNDFNNAYQRLKEKDKDAANPQRPRAYLNFVLFDEQFNLVEDNSGVKQVQATPDELQTLAQDKMVMEKSGFLYVYTSNESPQDVFFDNVTVLSLPGPMLEETHYYPFGLTMRGISTDATYSKLRNKYRYNGKELQDGEFGNGSGLEWYDYGARFYDLQIGRWQTHDPKLQYGSPYLSMGNNPINGVDSDGKWFWEKKHIRQAREYAKQTGGEFHKFKGSDGKNWASVQDKSGYTSSYTNADGVKSKEYNVTNQVFRPGKDRSDLLRATGKNSYDIDLTTKSGFEYVKGLAIMGDAWARGSGEFNREGQAPGIVKGIAGLNPLIGATNSIYSITVKKDMYGVDASSSADQTLAWVGLVSTIPGFGNLAKGAKFLPVGNSVVNAAVGAGTITDDALMEIGFLDDAGFFDPIKATLSK